jgi:hypothetical protein
MVAAGPSRAKQFSPFASWSSRLFDELLVELGEVQVVATSSGRPLH